MTLSQLKRIAGGKFFTAYFTKQNGERRRMTCRFGVKRYLRGGISSRKPGLAVVWVCDARAYRSFYLTPDVIIRANGKIYGGAR